METIDIDVVSSASLMEVNGELIGNSQLLTVMVKNVVDCFSCYN